MDKLIEALRVSQKITVIRMEHGDFLDYDALFKVAYNDLKGLVTNIVKNIPKAIAAWKAGDKKNLMTILGVPLEMNFTTYVNGLFYQSPSEKLI